MSKTYRTIPPGVDLSLDRFRNGLVAIPLKHNTDGHVGEGIWRSAAKAFFKRKRARKMRRNVVDCAAQM